MSTNTFPLFWKYLFLAQGEFIEHAVFAGNMYGTSKAAVETVRNKGLCLYQRNISFLKIPYSFQQYFFLILFAIFKRSEGGTCKLLINNFSSFSKKLWKLFGSGVGGGILQNIYPWSISILSDICFLFSVFQKLKH